MQPMQFQPIKQEIDTVPLEVHNATIKQLAAVQDELIRCRQKVAHLLKEKESK